MLSNHYFVDLYPIWKEKLSQAQGQVTFVSPYLTPRVADELIQLIPPERCTVYTRFMLENFAFGSSSFRTVNHLVQSGYTVYMVDKLHSKIVLIHGEFATIGSQNLTQRGRKNLEASVVLTERREVAQLTEELGKSIRHKLQISLGMLDDMSKLLCPLRTQMRQLKRQCYLADKNIWVDEMKRKIATAIARRENGSEKEKQIETIEVKLNNYCYDGKVPLTVAQYFIRRTARWVRHLGYNDVPAPRHAKRIVGVDGKDWRIVFGGNRFFVGRAIQRCCKAMHAMLKEVEAGTLPNRRASKVQLEELVTSSVGTFSLEENMGAYPKRGDYMYLGAQAIDVFAFVHEFMKLIPDEFFQPEAVEQLTLETGETTTPTQ